MDLWLKYPHKLGNQHFGLSNRTSNLSITTITQCEYLYSPTKLLTFVYFSDVTKRSAARSSLLLQHEQLLLKLFKEAVTKVKKTGTPIGKKPRIRCPIFLQELYKFHFNRDLPHEEKYVHTLSGVWWKKQKIKRSMGLKISHPLYPSLWYLERLVKKGFLASTEGVQSFRDHYMVVEEIFLLPSCGEIIIVGPQYTYQLIGEHIRRSRSHLRMVFINEGKIALHFRHIHKIIYIAKVKLKEVVVKYWDI